jgi:glycerol-3-phosphate acyltransferase PlsY
LALDAVECQIYQATRTRTILVVLLAGAAVAAHLVGCFPSARLVGRVAGFDPAAQGSGNPGATNALRLGGRSAGVAVLVLDVAKGALPAFVGTRVGGTRAGALLGAAAVTGHVLPVTQVFRGGGKGVATAAGAALAVEPVASLIAAGAFGVGYAATRRASVASLAGAVTLPVAVAAARRPIGEVATWTALAAVLVARHAPNIRRLLEGTEPATTLGDA